MSIDFKNFKISFEKVILFLILTIIFQNSCTQISRLTSINSKLISQRINNLIDLNGDGKSDLVFWNVYNLQSDERLHKNCFFETINFPNVNYQLNVLGNVGDIPVYGDFTGDGTFDYGIYRQNEGGNTWYLIDGLTKSSFGYRYGEVGDLPIPNDYDGDGKYDFVVYRPKNSGFYGYLSNKNKLLEIHFGLTGDIPLSKDFDGDNSADLATYRAHSGDWTIRSSQNGLTKHILLGGPEYLPIPADYDGDGKCDLAVWNYRNNHCKVIFSFFNQKISKKTSLEIKEKLKGRKCFPISSDFDGDGKSELAFWEYGEKVLHTFKVKTNSFQYEQVNQSIKYKPEPINYFLIKKFLFRNKKLQEAGVYKSGIITFTNLKLKNILSNRFNGDYDGDFINDKVIYNSNTKILNIILSSDKSQKVISFSSIFGISSNFEPLSGDFDGDGKYDPGIILPKEKKFSYLSSALNKIINLNLDNRINGVPFSSDIDLDFISDLIFYNTDTNIFGVIQSSNSYRYDEVLSKS